MNMKFVSMIIFLISNRIFFVPVLSQNSFVVVRKATSRFPLSRKVGYKCKFINLWTTSRHPNNYPSSAHWSPMVVVGHNSTYKMWSPGTIATTGIENVAELGSNEELLKEISAAGMAANAPVQGGALFLGVLGSDSQELPTCSVDSKHPLLSSITMVAPSPDWFTGFYNFDARSVGGSTRRWYSSFVIETYPFDAGTENGDNYSLDNQATSPRQSIYQYTINTTPTTTNVFENADMTTVLPVARWECNIVP